MCSVRGGDLAPGVQPFTYGAPHPSTFLPLQANRSERWNHSLLQCRLLSFMLLAPL